MASYVVMEPPLADAQDRAAEARVMRDGFVVWAFLLPFFWFLFHRMWIEAAIALVLTFALGFIDDWAGFAGAATVATVLLSLIAGFEAQNLRVAALTRRGWRQWGIVEARGHGEAELRYLAEAGLEDEAPAAPVAMPSEASPARAASVPSVPRGHAPALGMFDYPGGR